MGQKISKIKVLPYQSNCENNLTKDILIFRYGNNYIKSTYKSGFLPHFENEKYYLITTNENSFDERLLWSNGINVIVAYIKNNNVIKIYY